MNLQQLNEVTKSSTVTVVDFYANWCRPCVNLAPKLDAIKREYSGKINVVKINISEHKEYAIQYQVRSIPRLIIFKEGQIINNMADTRNMAVLRHQIDKALNPTTNGEV